MNNPIDIKSEIATLKKQGRYPEAQQVLMQANSATPGDASILLELGILFTEIGDHIAAEKWLSKAVESSAGDPDTHTLLGETLFRLDRPGDAITEYQIAISIAPDNPVAHYCLASLLMTAGQLEDAEYHYEYATRLTPDNPDYHTELGQVYLKMNRPGEAHESAMHALNLENKHAAALDLLSSIQAQATKASSATSNESTVEQPVVSEKLGEYCIEFALKRLYITDNRFIFTVPASGFCRNCFQFRFLSQMDGTAIDRVSDDALNLARKLDAEPARDNIWGVYSIGEQRQIKTFILAPYDNCPACDDIQISSRDDARSSYKRLLAQESKPRLDALKQQLFSFGFARDAIVSRKTHLPNPVFDRLLGDNYHARLHSKITYPDGRQIEEFPMGLSPDRDTAELKSFMEFIERYAYFSRSCRLITREHDDRLISRFMKQYTEAPSEADLQHIRQQALWGINLISEDVCPIPYAFIFNTGRPGFIEPNTSGFGAHTDFRKSLCSSILELVERDAFVRFWHDPRRAYTFEPEQHIQSDIESIIAILGNALDNRELASKCFIVESPTRLPVVMITLSSSNFSRPPSLCFGYGVGFDLAAATAAALNEFRTNTVNLAKAITMLNGFLTRTFTDRIESFQDRMNFYSTPAPRKELHFLDNENPLVDGVAENAEQAGLDVLVDRFRQAELDIYGIDVTPRCFRDKNIFATRAFSPELYPLQFGRENVLNLHVDPASPCNKLPHFFI